ncbi:hypothetical protein F4825DRAFT_457812 [Nemania diffusa]|nr:hypothetical protein F4825DRAFT_457812 [Nemania diffusa]
MSAAFNQYYRVYQISIPRSSLGYQQLDLRPQLNTSQPRARSFSPAKSNIKTVERTLASPSRAEQRRSEREPYETSRHSTKTPRTDYGQRQSPQQASQDQPRSEYKQKKSEGGILSKTANIIFGPSRGTASASSRSQTHASQKNEGKRSNKPREIQKAATCETYSPGREAEGREAQYGSSRQGGSDSRQDVKAAILGHRIVTVDPSQMDGNYGGEMVPEEYLGEDWELEGGTYRIKPRYGSNGG